jgi:hypothetical protein
VKKSRYTVGKNKDIAGLNFRKRWLKMQLAETTLTDVREYFIILTELAV